MKNDDNDIESMQWYLPLDFQHTVHTVTILELWEFLYDDATPSKDTQTVQHQGSP